VTDTQDLIDFLRAAVTRYPKVDYWEIYNEPDRLGSLRSKWRRLRGHA